MTTINQKLVVQKTISPVDGSVYVERPLANCEEINEKLRVAPDAPWEAIVAAHRRLVRWWHPDGLGPDAGDDERELSETRMRELSAAYRELRIRRGR